MELQTRIYTEPYAFTELKSEWLDLLSRSVTNYVFQTPQFQEAWWSTLGEGELHIITVRTEDGRLVGLAPLFYQKTENTEKELNFIGCVNVSDYLDFLVDAQFQDKVYEQLRVALEDEIKKGSSLFLCSLPESSPSRSWLNRLFPDSIETQQDVSPCIQLPKTWDEYLANLDRKQRHELKRKLRRLEENVHQFDLVSNKHEARSAVKQFIHLHQLSSAEKKSFWDSKHLGFFTKCIPAAAEAGWLRLYFLKIEGEYAAAMLLFDYNNQYVLYNSGFNPDKFRQLSPGTVLTAYTIQKALEYSKTEYDFLRGDEEYKFRFGAVSRAVYDVHLRRSQ